MDNFAKDSIVPDMLDNVPSNVLQVNYEGIDLKPGDPKTPTQVKDTPAVKWETEDGAMYTLIFADPDAPSREDPKFGAFNHWLVTNIPGNDITAGDTNIEYLSSAPGKGSGLHRYVFLVYKQTQKITIEGPKVDKCTIDGRRSWKLREFSAKYALGDPVAGNFYQAEWDEYVPNVRKQLGLPN